MNNQQSKSAFTMIELVFVIVVIGILASVAIPRFAATRDDAEVTKAKVLIASVRNALSMERQKRILRGDFTPITSVGTSDANNSFDVFSADKDGNRKNVLEYSVPSSTDKGKWDFNVTAPNQYTFHMLGDVAFKIDNGRFVCVDENLTECKTLTN